LRPGYFAAAGTLLQPGELIFASVRPRCGRRVSAGRRHGASGPGRGPGPDVHMALLMVMRAAERSAGRGALVRLVQDFGCPDDPGAAREPAPARVPAAAPAVPQTPVKRGRGRPPGSRTRKNGALPTMSVN